MMLLASCATTPPKTGSLGEYYRNLEFGPKAGAKLPWGSRELISRNTRDLWSIMYVLFALAEDSESKVINRDEMKKLGDACTLAILEALKDKYPIESEPGPAVLRFRFAIVDLKQSRPVQSAVTTVLSIGLGISLLRKGATDSWSGSGATTCQFMVLDSMPNEVIVVAEDEYRAGFTERFSKWGSVEEAFKYWGERIRKIADDGLAPGK